MRSRVSGTATRNKSIDGNIVLRQLLLKRLDLWSATWSVPEVKGSINKNSASATWGEGMEQGTSQSLSHVERWNQLRSTTEVPGHSHENRRTW